MNRIAWPDWSGLAERSIACKGVLLILVVLGVLVAGYVLWLHALRLELEDGAVADRQLRLELADKAHQARELDALQATLDDARQQLQEARWRLAAGGDMAELLEQLSNLGREQGLLFEQVDVLDEVAEPGYQRIPLALRVVGRYRALRLWLDQWLGQLRLLRVQQLRLEAVDGQPGLLRLQVQVNAYHSGQEDLPIPGALATEPAMPAAQPPLVNPFRRVTDAEVSGSLASVPLEQLKMVGSLARQGEYHALLRLGGHVHRVRLGDRLGRDQGRVVKIEEQQVEVLERLFVGGQGWLELSRYLVLGKSTPREVMDEGDNTVGAAVGGDPDGQDGAGGTGLSG